MIRWRSAKLAGARATWRRSREAQRGMALMYAVMLAMVCTLMLAAGVSFTQNSQRVTRTVKYDQQVYNVARAGLVDAINYFKRQTVQPVSKFRPTYNAAVPTRGDTNDPYMLDPGQAGGRLHQDDPVPGGTPQDKPHLGIVQEFQLDPRSNLWGRYEVGKIARLDKDAQGKLRRYSILEQDGQGAWIPKTLAQANSRLWEGVEDVSGNYGLQGQGLIWRIRSHGYIYKKDPAATPETRFYDFPNEVLAQVELETEIRRLQVEDYSAAIHGLAGNTIRFNDGKRVQVVAPNGYCVKFLGPNRPQPDPPATTFDGTNGTYQAAGDSLNWFEMFAVNDGQTLASMADAYVTDIEELPKSMSSMALTYFKGDATFTQQRPLNGGGILVVDGNLTLQAGSASTFSGVIYVTGNYRQSSPSVVAGQIVVRGNVLVESPSDTAIVEYNSGIIGEVRRQLGQYRERRSGQRVTPL